MNSRRPKLGRNMLRAGSGGVAVVLALIALMFFQSGHLGDGDSDGEGEGENQDAVEPLASTEPDALPVTVTSNSSTPEPPEPADTDHAEDGGLTDDEKRALADGVLEILIDENDYFLVLPGAVTIYRPAEMSQLMRLAEQTSGDSNGIRVRILRRESSRAKAEIDLKTALAGIGIGADAVYMPQEFLAK